jgi:hypothetical protein
VVWIRTHRRDAEKEGSPHLSSARRALLSYIPLLRVHPGVNL